MITGHWVPPANTARIGDVVDGARRALALRPMRIVTVVGSAGPSVVDGDMSLVAGAVALVASKIGRRVMGVTLTPATGAKGVAVGCKINGCAGLVTVGSGARVNVAASSAGVAVGRRVIAVDAAGVARLDHAAERNVSCGDWVMGSTVALSANQSAKGSGVAPNQCW